MTKKRLLLFGGFLGVCILLPLGVAAMMPPIPGVTKANYHRIHEGMKLAEVEEVFGTKGESIRLQRPGDWMIWVSPDGSAGAVFYFERDEVVYGDWTDSEESFFDKIRRWLHLP
jgi:hypothetical protein